MIWNPPWPSGLTEGVVVSTFMKGFYEGVVYVCCFGPRSDCIFNTNISMKLEIQFQNVMAVMKMFRFICNVFWLFQEKKVKNKKANKKPVGKSKKAKEEDSDDSDDDDDDDDDSEEEEVMVLVVGSIDRIDSLVDLSDKV